MIQANDIGIELGSSVISIYMKGNGIVLREPAVVAVEKENRRIIAMGTEAFRMIGRTPSGIQVVRPLAQGEMVDFELTGALMRSFITSVIGRRHFSHPRAIMALPTGIKDIEKRALVTAMFDAGIRRTQLLDKNIAAALGAQMNVLGSIGCMVVDIGAGGTDMAVLYNGTPAVVSTVKTGGDRFDEAVIRYLRRKYNLLIGERTAEQVKITLGSAVRRDSSVSMDVTGRNLISGLPKTLNIESNEIYESLVDCVNDLIEGIQIMIEKTPPQLASDIFETGMVLTGGGANLYGISEAIGTVLKVPCRVAQDPRDCVVNGCARVLEEPAELRHLLES